MNSSDISNSSYDTDPILHMFVPHIQIYRVIFLLIGFSVFFLNLAVIVSASFMLKNTQQNQKTTTYIFLLNLAVADLLESCAVMFSDIFPLEFSGHYTCLFRMSIITACSMSSVYSVGLIAIDRFLYITRGLYYKKMVTPTRGGLLIIFTWFIGCAVGFLPVFGWERDHYNGEVCWFVIIAPNALIFLIIVMAFIPITVVVALYSIILYYAIQNVLKLTRQQSHTTKLRCFFGGTKPANGAAAATTMAKNASATPNKWNAIKVVVFTTGAFLLFWVPYFVATLIYIYRCDDETTGDCKQFHVLIACPLAMLGFANSLVNPIIYAWWHNGFRGFVRSQIFPKIRKISKFGMNFNNNEHLEHGEKKGCTNKKDVEGD